MLVSLVGAREVGRMREDVLVMAMRTGQPYDVILDTVGTLPVAAARASFRAPLELLADGSLEVVHDRAYPLDDVTSAHARVDSGGKVGVVLLRP